MRTPLLDPTLQGLANALTVHNRRHTVLATNLANVETPGYRAQDVDFRTELRRAFQAPEVGGTAKVDPRVIDDDDVAPRADGNTVDLDMQMAELSDNAGRYVALTRILSKRLGLLRSAIEGTR
ncbi:MAG: flagellar basal body rod protein FlgB [bacterium]|nr:flagellar basal body rod protein FlgB [bacterium]